MQTDELCARRPEKLGNALQQFVFLLREQAEAQVNALEQLRQRLSALEPRQRHFCLEGRRLIATGVVSSILLLFMRLSPSIGAETSLVRLSGFLGQPLV